MKLPRDLAGADLATALAVFGYQISRQTGSHVLPEDTGEESLAG